MKEKNYAASVTLQFVLLTLFTIFLFWILHRPSIIFEAKDKEPPLIQITPQKIMQLGVDPGIIQVGLYIRDFPEFNIAEDTFTADITVWFRFNPIITPLKKVEKFKFDKANIIEKSAPYIQKEKDQMIFVRYNMKITFSANLNYIYFPLDDHRIAFSLTNYLLSPKDTIFKSYKSDIFMNPDVEVPEWKLIGKAVKTGYIEDKLDPQYKEKYLYHPRVIFYLDFMRSGIRHLISIFIPLVLIFLIALFTFTFNPYTDLSNIIGISVASISAIIAQRFVIEGMSPSTGGLMLSDKLFILFLVGCCIIFTVNILGKKITSPYKNLITILLHLYIIAGFLYFLLPIIK